MSIDILNEVNVFDMIQGVFESFHVYHPLNQEDAFPVSVILVFPTLNIA